MAVFEAVLAGQFPGSAPFGGLCPDSVSGRFAAHFCPDEPFRLVNWSNPLRETRIIAAWAHRGY